jgi:GT2 family glycosyltransferase
VAGIPADRCLLLSENRGYSGGANAGLAAARGGKLLLCNADVVFQAGAVAALAAALEDSTVGVAAPVCVWDEGGRLLLPPGFAPGFWRDWEQLSAGRRPRADNRRFAGFARETLRLWREGGRAPHLSGAVLAVRRGVFDLVGRFDERFPFEYEETEWEERVAAAGLELTLVHEARVRHLWARSSSRNPESAARRAQSQRLYRDRRYGRGGRLLLERASRRSRPPALRVETGTVPPSFPPRPGAFLAVSPNPSRLPFAGADLEVGFTFPPEIRDALAGRWYFSVFRRSDGQPLETFAWEKV